MSDSTRLFEERLRAGDGESNCELATQPLRGVQREALIKCQGLIARRRLR